MTPEERARHVLDLDAKGQICLVSVAALASVIRAAVAEEREACALAVEMFGTSRPLTGYGDLQERLAGIIRGRAGS